MRVFEKLKKETNSIESIKIQRRQMIFLQSIYGYWKFTRGTY